MSKKGQKGKELLAKLQKGAPLAPIYYIYGEDPYLIEALVGHLRGRINPAFKDFNLHHVTGGEASGEKIASLANHLPVMDACCVVLVREAQQLKKADWDELIPYLQDPSETTCLIFLDLQKKAQLDQRTKAGKLVSKFTVECAKPFDNQMPRWVQERAREHKVKLDGDANHRLLELLGSDLASLNNALERLSLYLGGKGHVTVETVNEVIAENRTYNVFDLAGLIGHRDLQGALRLLHGLLATREAPLKLLALLAKAFRDLLRARAEFEQGATPQDLDKYIPRQLRFKRNERLRAFVEQVRRFNCQELSQALVLMHQTDLALKSTSGLTDTLIMERLVLELCHLNVPQT